MANEDGQPPHPPNGGRGEHPNTNMPPLGITSLIFVRYRRIPDLSKPWAGPLQPESCRCGSAPSGRL